MASTPATGLPMQTRSAAGDIPQNRRARPACAPPTVAKRVGWDYEVRPVDTQRPEPDRSYRAPAVRVVGRVAALGAWLSGVPGCLLEFPQRLEPAEAGAPDAAGDAAPIERERFDWDFAAYGVLADPGGSLHGFEATGATDDNGRVRFGRVTLDTDVVLVTAAEEPRSLGNGGFRLGLPDVGALTNADLVFVRDDETGIGGAEVVTADGHWGGPIVMVRYGQNEPVGSRESAKDFRFIQVGAAQGAPTALMARGGLGSGFFSLGDGIALGGEDGPRLESAEVESLAYGGFQVLEPDFALRGIRGHDRAFMAALRWSAVSDNPQTGDVAHPLPELWLGTRAVSSGPGGVALQGRWHLSGVSLQDSTRWVAETFTLVVSVTPEAVRYAYLNAAGDELEAGHIDGQTGSMLPFGGVVGLTSDAPSPSVRWFGMGPDDPPYLVIWGTDGRAPTTRLFFGLRER